MNPTPAGALAKVRRATAKRTTAERELRAAILAAVAGGASQADVARAAGLTRGRVHQIVTEERSS